MKQIIYILSILLLAGCQSNLTDPPGHFSQLVDLQALNYNDHQLLMILDQNKNQLFLYDTVDKCYFDNDLSIPGENGLNLPTLPYKMVTSSDQQKVVILSNSGSLSIINLDPLSNLHLQKECSQTVLPYSEAQYPLEQQPDTLFIKKGSELDYHIYLVYYQSGEVVDLHYNSGTFTELDRHTYSGEITTATYDNDQIYLTLSGEEKIYTYGDDAATITLGSEIQSPYFTHLLESEQFFILYDQQGQQLLIWDRNLAKYVTIPGTTDPLSLDIKQSGYPLRYPLYDLKIFDNTVPKEFPFNGTGRPETYQLLPGKYIVVTDTSGYLYFISLEHSLDQVSTFSVDDYDNLDSYKTALNQRYRSFNIPRYNDYIPEVTYLSQEQTCTQFNRQEANGCFNITNNESEYSNQQYISLSAKVTSGDYHLKGEQFRFTYNGTAIGFTGDDGALNQGILTSQSVDFSPLSDKKEHLSLELLGKLSSEKENDHTCGIYAAGEPILLPIKAISGHTITPDLTDHPQLEFCFDQALPFEIRGDDTFVLSGSMSGFIDIVQPCTHNQEENPKRPLCDENQESYRYQNDLFSVEIFSDNSNVDVDSRISFYLSGTSYQMRFTYSMVAPGKVLTLQQDDGNHQIFVMDYHKNQIYKIESRYLNSVEDILQ